MCNPVTAPMLEESPTSVVDGESEEEVEEAFTDVRMQGGAEFAAEMAAQEEEEEVEQKKARAAKVDLHPEDDHEGDHESE